MTRDELRRVMPTVAALVDGVKESFGADQVRVTWAREGGVEVGRRDAAEYVKASPPVGGSMGRKS